MERTGHCDLFYGDEGGFCLPPTLIRCWQPPGPTLSLPAQAHGKRLDVVGFWRNGDGELAHVARGGRLGATAFIEAVESRLLPALVGRQRPAGLVLDNGPCHRNRLVRARRPQWRAEGLRLFCLPPCGPHLNRPSRPSGAWSNAAGSLPRLTPVSLPFAETSATPPTTQIAR